jgi:exodeoxyribonuclease V alpha subunit
VHSAIFHPLDEQLAVLLQRLGGGVENETLRRLAMHVSERTRNGVIAAPLADLPEFDRSALHDSPVVGKPGDYRPLIVSDTHAWLYRYWQYEQRLAECINSRRDPAVPAFQLPPAPLPGVSEDFGDIPRLLVISGGPGTGKTTTVTRILAHLQRKGMAASRILLAAPTGKAAMRMQESIRDTRQRLGITGEMPEQASTLHRLLGYIPNRVGFRHHAGHPLAADVVIVDEASMIDISLMTHLFEALAPQTRLILLGDRDQLASVETGSIFRDLCSAPALQGNIVLLQQSYRFSAEDSIGQLAEAIRSADGRRLLEIFASPDYPDATLDESGMGLDARMLRDGWQDYVTAVQGQDIDAVFRAFNALRILTPLRKGRLGVEALNAWGDAVMQRLLPVSTNASRPWYVGRPVMVTQNDYRQNLFNGDIGIALPNGRGELRVWFPSGEAGQYRALAPIRLPAHETAWAMTIHKSQGSEFTRVLLILPEADDLPLLGRELLYTAVTRARQGIHVLARRETLLKALQQVAPAASCLQEKLG